MGRVVQALPGEGNLNLYRWVSHSVFTKKKQAQRTGLYLLFVSQTSCDLKAVDPASEKHRTSLLPADAFLLASPQAGLPSL